MFIARLSGNVKALDAASPITRIPNYLFVPTKWMGLEHRLEMSVVALANELQQRGMSLSIRRGDETRWALAGTVSV